MNIDKNKLLKTLLLLTAITLISASLIKLLGGNSKTLEEYAQENPDVAYRESSVEKASDNSEEAPILEEDTSPSAETLSIDSEENNFLSTDDSGSLLTGALLNKDIPESDRTTFQPHFYYEPLSEDLRRYITGVSYPGTTDTPSASSTFDTADSADISASAGSSGSAGSSDSGSISDYSGISEIQNTLQISYEDLCYVHILHYDFAGNPAEGELICNKLIAQDLVEIFYELYVNEYQLEKVLLIDAYDGDDTASMEDNNTSCFNYRTVEGSTSLSRHSLGLAIDINPLYNPYVTYPSPGEEKVSPVSAQPYADRSQSFSYKIDENDLCYKLFTEHGFTWGGNWNSCKDYQHFQKTP